MLDYIYSGYTHIGGRNNNEDNYIAIKNEDNYLFAVADGVGGHTCGQVASEIIIRTLEELFCNNSDEFDLEMAIRQANEKIILAQKQMKNNMQTTITAVYINDSMTVCANVGDSRTYFFKNNHVVFQTTDHSVAQMAVALGEIQKEDIRNHEDRNIITRTIGYSFEEKIDIRIFKNTDFENIILCTDGFWEYVLEDEMCKIQERNTTPDECLSEMRKILMERVPKKHDNNTAIMVMKRGC